MHTLDVIMNNWYIELEVRRGKKYCKHLNWKFKVTFKFEDDSPSIETTLHITKNKIFTSEDSMRLVPLCSAPRYSSTIQKFLECYNVAGEDQEDENPRNL